jgi:hypothetical protein
MVHGGSKPESLRAARQRPPAVVLTVGHSTRSQEGFIALLQAPAQASRLPEASEQKPRRPNAPDLARGSRAAAPIGSDEASSCHGIT